MLLFAGRWRVIRTIKDLKKASHEEVKAAVSR